MYIIETNNLCKSYGKSRGIINVNLKVKEGEIFGFVGPNGAGKSTTIRTLLNFIFPTSGTAKILGKDIVKESNEIKKYVGYVPSEVKFYDEVKVKNIIKYSSSFYNGVNKEEVERLYKILDVDINKKMSELSLGNKKKVAIVQALIHKPKLLILDEPTNGLDPLIQKRLFELLEEAKKNGTTVFLSSHNLVEIEKFCDRVAVIKDGKIIDTIVMDKLYNNLGLKVVIKSNEINEEKIKEMGGDITFRDKDEFIFSYSNSIDSLIKELSRYKIEKLLISEKTFEDMFMNYYEIKGEK